MSDSMQPARNPSSVEAQIERLVGEQREQIQFNKDLIRTLETENDVLEEVIDELVNIISPPKPEGPRLTSANTLPVYSQGYSSMQAQAALHAATRAAQVRADMDLPEPVNSMENRGHKLQGRVMKDNPQA